MTGAAPQQPDDRDRASDPPGPGQPAVTRAHAGAPPRCPRCGYDVSGPMPTWTDSCPVEGVCTECGLGFRWHDVLHPDRKLLAWLFEHARGPRRTARAFVSTAARSLWPVSFWKRVEMSHAIRWKRLAVYVPVCWLILHVVLAFGRFAPLVEMFPGARADAKLARDILTTDYTKYPPPAPDDLGQWVERTPMGTGWLASRAAQSPTWTKYAQSFHLYYIFHADPPMDAPRRLGLSPTQRFGDRPEITGQWSAVIYPAPPWIAKPGGPSTLDLIEQRVGWMWQDPLRMLAWPYTGPWETLSAGVFFAKPVTIPLIAGAILPFTFIALTTTLGRAGVRAFHLLRGAGYGLGGLIVLHITSSIVAITATASDFDFGGLLVHWEEVHFFGGALWLLLSWWMFCKRYLKIPHAFWVAFLLSIIAYLLIGVAMFAYSQMS